MRNLLPEFRPLKGDAHKNLRLRKCVDRIHCAPRNRAQADRILTKKPIASNQTARNESFAETSRYRCRPVVVGVTRSVFSYQASVAESLRSDFDQSIRAPKAELRLLTDAEAQAARKSRRRKVKLYAPGRHSDSGGGYGE